MTKKTKIILVVVGIMIAIFSSLLTKALSPVEVITTTASSDEIKSQLELLNNRLKHVSIQINDAKYKIESIDFSIETMQREIGEIPGKFKGLRNTAAKTNNIDSLMQIALRDE